MYRRTVTAAVQAHLPPAFVRLAAHPLRWLLLTTLADGDLRVRELVAELNQPQNLLSYHLRHLRDAGLVTATRSSYDGRDSYYHLDLDRCAEGLAQTAASLHPVLAPAAAQATPAPLASTGRPSSRPGAVLFLCTGNSARSPIAEALMRHHGADSVTVTSAGTHPRPCLHPHTVRVLHDHFGISVAGQQPRHVDTLVGRRFNRVVTLCDKAREACPEFAHHPRRVHWSIPDPATGGTDRASYPAFRKIATDIDIRVRRLLLTMDPPYQQRSLRP
jgi:protein-tyrosine-phosphatase/DNA-binding transcriptional ArsR family regulator